MCECVDVHESFVNITRIMSKENQNSGYVDNWQGGKTVTECNLHMLTTEDCSDVIFRVGSEKHVVRAHRFVLVSRSCVFHAMFCGPLAEKGEITIPDIDPVIFKEFLRYLYTDTSTITANTLTGLLYTSRKYAVDGLFKSCTMFLEESLSEENVCEVLEQCHGYGEVDLEQKALKILTEAGEKVIKSQGFLKICSSCLGKFLSSEQLKLKEEDVFEAALSWTKEECKRENVNSAPENIRIYLGDYRYNIRFSELPLEFLVDAVGPSGILTGDERLKIMDKIVRSKTDISPFKSDPRKYVDAGKEIYFLTNHFVNRYNTMTNGPFDSTKCAVSFVVSRDIKLMGCQLYGPTYKSEFTFSLNVILYDDQNEAISQPLVNTPTTLIRKLNDVLFPSPVPVLADRTYTIYVSIPGIITYFGNEGQTSVEVDGVTFMFTGSNLNGYGSRIDFGQIPGLIWR